MENVSLNKILRQNEKEANIQTARVMLITFLLFTVVYILELLGIFIVKKNIMTISYIISSFILLLPTVINKCIGPSAKGLKYLYVLLSGLFMFVITTTLTFHVVIVYAYPIAIAGMYFSKKLTQIAIVMTIIVTICGQLCGFYMDFCHDNNFGNLYKLVVYGILPRLLTLISFSALLNTLSQRTSKLLEEDIENYDKLVMYNSEMVYSFATLIENRDENTGGHIKRTSIYVRLLAQELKKENFYCDIITDDFIKNLVMVAPLHDIGKISIPDSILQKPDKLTYEEYEIMKTHSAKGGEIIKESFVHTADDEYKNMAYEVARYHHEKWNGRGYPEGLSKEDIPLSARIMSVADVFDAISEKRCYRDAIPLEKCFSIIQEGKGTDFDPVLVDAFLNIRDDIIKVHEHGINN